MKNIQDILYHDIQKKSCINIFGQNLGHKRLKNSFRHFFVYDLFQENVKVLIFLMIIFLPYYAKIHVEFLLKSFFTTPLKQQSSDLSNGKGQE